jgi:ASC-1-like (ASCH) protein
MIVWKILKEDEFFKNYIIDKLNIIIELMNIICSEIEKNSYKDISIEKFFECKNKCEELLKKYEDIFKSNKLDNYSNIRILESDIKNFIGSKIGYFYERNDSLRNKLSQILLILMIFYRRFNIKYSIFNADLSPVFKICKYI